MVGDNDADGDSHRTSQVCILFFFFFSVQSLMFSAFFFFNLGLGDGGCGFCLTEDGVGLGWVLFD